MAVALRERASATSATELEALAAWARARVGHRHVEVVAGGVLQEPRDGHDLGVPYVTVIARTLDAAEAAEADLRSLARIDESRWQRGWREIAGPRLAIDIYPDAPAEFVATFTDRWEIEQAQRRSDLEDIVAEHLQGTRGIEIVDSGTRDGDNGSAAGTGYVDIAVRSVDAAERAELRLADIGGVAPEAWGRGWQEVDGQLVLRLYPTA